MTEYEVTGISHRIGRGLLRDEAKAAAHEFITKLKPGTPLILMAEPSNTHDENAIAVYLDYTKHIGYIKSSRCLELKALLDGDGQCDAEDLSVKYGKGFDTSTLYRYLLFFRLFPETVAAVRPQSGKVAAVRPQLLPWTHYRELIRVDNPDARAWYEQEALQEGWSTRTLHRNIASQYYSRLLKSQHQENVREEMHQLTTAYEQDKLEFIKNPVVAEFLGLQTDIDYTETKLESSIISHMQKFIMEMGKGFAFVARQQHIRTDMGDYYIDLVFYNYILKCFFLIDLKTTQISHQDVGQMDMYVRMYDELKRSEGDDSTIGLLLCSETSEDMARYSVLNNNNQLYQAKYLTYLPTQEELRREIERQKAVFELQNREDDGEQNV